MINKELNQIFSDKLKNRFVELGFPKNTALKIAKLMSHIEVLDNKVVTHCKDEFYRDEIILPQKQEIEKLVKLCWGSEFSFEILNDDIYNSKVFQKKLLKPSDEIIKEKIKQDNEEQKNIVFQADELNQKKEFSPAAQNSSGRQLESELNFSTFVRCQSNLAAYTACESVANNPGNLSNPLFIYGATGLGKTHLLHSVGNEVLKNNKNFNVLYVTSNDFVNDVIHRGIKAGKMEEVRRKYNSCDILLVDDIQFLENKDACQIEFFHTFNELYQNKKQIVITCDKFPKDIPNIEERLKSRFLQGLLVDVEPPGYEDRVALIETKSQQASLNLDQEACFLIATHAKTNVREIEGLLKDLLISKEMNGNCLTKENLMNILKRRFPNNQITPDLDIVSIQKAVCNHFQIKMSELMGQTRQKKFVLARHIAMFLAKEMLNLQVVEISDSFGKKDHTTALHAIGKVREMLGRDSELTDNLLIIKKKLEEKLN